MMTFISGFLCGLISGFLIYFIFKHKYKNNNKVVNHQRRGLYTCQFTRINSYNKTEYTVTAEIIELERTSTKSKIKAINVKCDLTTSDSEMKKIKKLIDGWFSTNSPLIEWFGPHPEDIRIDKLLK